MDIEVNRVFKEDGSLTFEIVVKEPHLAPFGDVEERIMQMLDNSETTLSLHLEEDNKTHHDVISMIRNTKNRLFGRVINSLHFTIRERLQTKFNPICQEIYNWIFDHQEGRLKSWMIDFDPERTRFYFDNDPEKNTADDMNPYNQD